MRGGSWNNEARRLRSAYRNERHRDNRNEHLNDQGFRFALSSMEPTHGLAENHGPDATSCRHGLSCR